MARKPEIRPVTIANGGTTSAAIPVGPFAIAGVLIPASFEGAAITFTASDTPDGTFYAVYDSDGTEVSLAASSSRAVGLSGAEADALAPWTWVKLVCGTAQTGDIELSLVLK